MPRAALEEAYIHWILPPWQLSRHKSFTVYLGVVHTVHCRDTEPDFLSTSPSCPVRHGRLPPQQMWGRETVQLRVIWREFSVQCLFPWWRPSTNNTNEALVWFAWTSWLAKRFVRETDDTDSNQLSCFQRLKTNINAFHKVRRPCSRQGVQSLRGSHSCPRLGIVRVTQLRWLQWHTNFQSFLLSKNSLWKIPKIENYRYEIIS